MLTKINTEKANNEIIIDTDTLCTQIESDNPLLFNRDMVFSQKNKSFENSDSCVLPGHISEFRKESSIFFQDGLKRALKRLKKRPTNKELFNSVAQNYMRIGEIEKAIEKLEEAMALDHSFFPVISNLAECLLLKNEIDKAIELYNSIEEDKQNDVRILTNKALLYLRKKDFNMALKLLITANKTQPDNSVVLNNLGMAYLALKQPNKAIQFFRKASKKKYNDFLLFNNLGVAYAVNNNPKKALSNFKIAYSLNKTDRNVIKNLVNAYHGFNEYESIVELLDSHLHSFPEDTELRTFTCDSYFQMGLYKKCLQELFKTLNYISDNESGIKKKASVHNNIAVVYERLNRDNNAKKHFIESFRNSPVPHIDFFYNIISFLLKIGEPENCFEFIKRAIKEYGKTPLLLIYLGKYYQRLQQYTDAKKAIHEALSIDEKLIDGYMDLSVIECEVFENNYEALKILEKGLSFYPENRILLNNFAYCKILTGDLSIARKILEKVGEIDDICLNATRGLLRIKENDIENGRRYYNKAITLAKTNKNLYALVNQKKNLELAKFYIEKNESKSALNALKKGLRYSANEQYYKNSIIKTLEQIQSK